MHNYVQQKHGTAWKEEDGSYSQLTSVYRSVDSFGWIVFSKNYQVLQLIIIRIY